MTPNWGPPLTEVPEPWRPLRDEARRAFDVVAERLVRARIIINLDRVMLTELCAAWAGYRRLMSERQRHPGAQGLQVEIAEWRKLLRDVASSFYLLSETRVNCAVLDNDGEDVELNQIFEFKPNV